MATFASISGSRMTHGLPFRKDQPHCRAVAQRAVTNNIQLVVRKSVRCPARGGVA